jgi:hypothetical protein
MNRLLNPCVALLLVGAIFYSASASANAGDKSTPLNEIIVPPTIANPPGRGEIFLVEQSLKSLRVVTKIDLPERVYLKKTKMDGVYQHFLTDKKKRLGPPEQILLAATVVRGDRIGGSPEKYYILTREGNWRRSEPPEIYFVQNDNDGRQGYIVTPRRDRSLDK